MHEELLIEFNSASELQNSYARSRMELGPFINETARIRELRLAGKFVVVKEHEVCCPRTDAFICMEIIIDSIHDTLGSARTVCPEEPLEDGPPSMYVAGPIEPEEPKDPSAPDYEDDFPF
jgi:hypothetical protein